MDKKIDGESKGQTDGQCQTYKAEDNNWYDELELERN